MYRIIVKSNGKYGNFELGARYTFSKRKAKKFIDFALSENAEVVVEKFCNCGGLFCWSDDHDLYGGTWYEWED